MRREKLQRMRAAGNDPYAFGYPRTATIAVTSRGVRGPGVDVATGKQVSIVGRVVLNRVSGKIIFASLRDGTGDLQVMLTLDASGQEALKPGRTTSTSATTSASPARSSRPSVASSACLPQSSPSPASACGHFPKSMLGCPTPKLACASATSTSLCGQKHATCSTCARRWCGVFASR